MPTLLERLTKKNVESFGIMDASGNTWFVEANRCKPRKGSLVFLTGWGVVVAVANDGTWQRMIRGLALDDLEDGE